MTHEERAWELYKEFLTVDYNGKIFQPYSEHEKRAGTYYKMAKAYATAFESLSAEAAKRTESCSPFESDIQKLELTAKEG